MFVVAYNDGAVVAYGCGCGDEKMDYTRRLLHELRTHSMYSCIAFHTCETDLAEVLELVHEAVQSRHREDQLRSPFDGMGAVDRRFLTS